MINPVFGPIKCPLLVACVILAGCRGLNSAKGPKAADALAGKAWQAKKNKDYQAVIAHAKKCIKYNEEESVKMQKVMTEPVPTSRDDLNKEAVTAKWALNYVGASYFVLSRAYEDLGKPAEALKAYQHLVKTLPFAHCWDPKGYYWKPASVARKRIEGLETALKQQ